MVDIRIDAPGAGDWIMQHVDGAFRDGFDHAFSSHEGDRILGGIALVDYLGSCMSMHMASDSPRWFSRDLAWLAFHYAFVQLKCTKLLAPVRSDNYNVLSINLRAGWNLETVIRNAYEPDVHLMVLSMTIDTCPWLDYTPRDWREAA